MKMIYNGVPVQSMKVNHYEMNTNSATVQPSDMQAGVTCFARGQKITGTGKSFEFANYGATFTNLPLVIPTTINVIEIASLDYPLQAFIALSDMKNTDFSISQTIGNVIINEDTYPITVIMSDGEMTISCDKTIKLQTFYGKDNYV